MNILLQGTHPTFGGFFHAVLQGVEQDVTNILASNGGKTFLHRILATGEVVTTEMNMPLVRSIVQAVDAAVSAQG